jgi:hypothetical protein
MTTELPNSPARRAEETTQRGVAVPQSAPPLPHERDQQNATTSPEPNAHIEQAAKDLAQGQVDTDLRATPGLDANRRGDMVNGGEHGAGKSKPPGQRG